MSADKEQIERARQELEGYMTHIPPAVCNGSWNRSVEFKAAVAAARKIMGKRNVALGELNSAKNNLHRFWEIK